MCGAPPVTLRRMTRPESWQRFVNALGRFLHRNWQRALRIRDKLRFREEAFHLLLAGGVGIIGGLVNVAFFHCIQLLQLLSYGRVGDLVTLARGLDPWMRFSVPLLGAVAAGLVLHLGARLLDSRRASNLLEVVAAGDGRLPMRNALVKGIASLLSIATGASLGREGSITQLTATCASKLGQVANWPPYRLRLLLACGAAAGIAAAYNAPLAGAVFAAQIVLGNFAMNLFAPLVFSSVVATIVSRSFFGMAPWYEAPGLDFTRLTQLPWFILLGLLAGVFGAVFLKMLRHAEFLFGKLPLPIYGRLALGGAAVGAIALAYPEVWGNGYGVTNQVLHENFTRGGTLLLWWLVGVTLAKLVATTATVGSGAVGGVFTPTLFLGAGLGTVFGVALNHAGYAQTLPTAAFGLVGMGALLAATTHSPLLSMIIVFEISLNYSLVPPLMLACAVATLMSRRLHPNSIYTEPLRAKGLLAEGESTEIGAALRQTVAELMLAPVPPVRDTQTLPEIADRFLTSPNNFLPVVDAQERLLGVVALHDLKEFLDAGQELRSVIASDVMRPPPVCVTPGQRLLDVMPVLLTSDIRNIPVVNSLTENRLVGALPRGEALSLVSDAIAATGAKRD
jgi:CIC family chloride channel protein